MAIPDKNMKSNPQGPGTQGPNRIAERDARARKARSGGMKRSGGNTSPVKRTPSTRPGRETTSGDDLYNSAEDRWARMTGTGRYANTPENNYDRMTGTGAFADGGGSEARLNRQRMFGQADEDARYRAAGPARRERALGGMAEYRAQTPSVGKKLASRTAKMPRKQRGSTPSTIPLFGGASIDENGNYRPRGYGG